MSDQREVEAWRVVSAAADDDHLSAADLAEVVYEQQERLTAGDEVATWSEERDALMAAARAVAEAWQREVTGYNAAQRNADLAAALNVLTGLTGLIEDFPSERPHGSPR